jgi:hypothetical protein
MSDLPPRDLSSEQMREGQMHILVGFGVVFGVLSLFLGARGAAVTMVWLAASFIVAGQLHLTMTWGDMLPVMAVTAIPFVAFEVLRSIVKRQRAMARNDDATLQEAVRREARWAAERDC